MGSAGPAHGQLLGSLVIGGSVGPHDLRCRGGICQSEHAIRILTSSPSVCSSLFSAPPALSSSRCPRSVTSATARRSAMATPSTPTSARTPMTRFARSHNPSLDPPHSHIPLAHAVQTRSTPHPFTLFIPPLIDSFFDAATSRPHNLYPTCTCIALLPPCAFLAAGSDPYPFGRPSTPTTKR